MSVCLICQEPATDIVEDVVEVDPIRDEETGILWKTWALVHVPVCRKHVREPKTIEREKVAGQCNLGERLLMPYRPPIHRPPGTQRRAEDSRERDRLRNDDDTRRLLKLRSYERFRKWIIAERPTCEECERAPAKHVHHKRKLRDHPEDLCDENEVAALCHSCHSVKTVRGE